MRQHEETGDWIATVAAAAGMRSDWPGPARVVGFTVGLHKLTKIQLFQGGCVPGPLGLVPVLEYCTAIPERDVPKGSMRSTLMTTKGTQR